MAHPNDQMPDEPEKKRKRKSINSTFVFIKLRHIN